MKGIVATVAVLVFVFALDYFVDIPYIPQVWECERGNVCMP